MEEWVSGGEERRLESGCGRLEELGRLDGDAYRDP